MSENWGEVGRYQVEGEIGSAEAVGSGGGEGDEHVGAGLDPRHRARQTQDEDGEAVAVAFNQTGSKPVSNRIGGREERDSRILISRMDSCSGD